MSITFRLTHGTDPEELLEEAALWKALHDEYGDEIAAVTGNVEATFGRGVCGDSDRLDYWDDPAFLANCHRRFTTVPLEHVEREVADLHRDGFGAFVKSTRSKHWIARIPIGQTFREAADAMVYSFIDGPLLMVQELCEIKHEHRFFVINRRTETYSQNHPSLTPIDYPGAQTNLTCEAFWPLHRVALDMARDMASAHAVVDVAYINGRPGVVELNPMRLGQVGLFACNIRALATASRALLPLAKSASLPHFCHNAQRALNRKGQLSD
jgi:hypothetical protein